MGSRTLLIRVRAVVLRGVLAASGAYGAALLAHLLIEKGWDPESVAKMILALAP